MLGGTLVGVLDFASGVPIGETDGVCGGGSEAPIVPGSELGGLRSSLCVGVLGIATELGTLALESPTLCVEAGDIKGLGVLACELDTLACELGAVLRLEGALLFGSSSAKLLDGVALDPGTARLLCRLEPLLGELGRGLDGALLVGVPPIGELGFLGFVPLLDVLLPDPPPPPGPDV